MGSNNVSLRDGGTLLQAHYLYEMAPTSTSDSDSRPTSSGSGPVYTLTVKPDRKRPGRIKVLSAEKQYTGSADKRPRPEEARPQRRDGKRRREIAPPTPPDQPRVTGERGSREVVEVAHPQGVGENVTVRQKAKAWLAERLPTTDRTRRETMLEMAFELGSGSVLTEVQDMLRAWRQDQTCLPNFTYGDVGTQELATTMKNRPWTPSKPMDRQFVALWDRQERAKTTDYLQRVLYRLYNADLRDRYDELQRSHIPRHNEKASTITKDIMFEWLYGPGPQDKATHERFDRVIKFSKRWARLRAECGSGILGLFSKKVNKTFCEQKTTDDEWEAWIELVRKYRLSVCDLGRELWPTLRTGLAGATMPEQVSVLEAWCGGEVDVETYGGRWMGSNANVLQTRPPRQGVHLLHRDDWEALFEENDFGSVILSSSPLQGSCEEEDDLSFLTSTQDVELAGLAP